MAVVKSPKSVAFPVEAVFTKSIIFAPGAGDEPPAKRVFVVSDRPTQSDLATVKSPKSVALPVLAIVIY